MMLTPEQRYRTEMLRTAMNAIFQEFQDFRRGERRLGVELAVTDSLCDEIEQFTKDDPDPAAQAWHQAAVATKQLGQDPSDEHLNWLDTYAALPPMAFPD